MLCSIFERIAQVFCLCLRRGFGKQLRKARTAAFECGGGRKALQLCQQNPELLPGAEGCLYELQRMVQRIQRISSGGIGLGLCLRAERKKERLRLLVAACSVQHLLRAGKKCGLLQFFRLRQRTALLSDGQRAAPRGKQRICAAAPVGTGRELRNKACHTKGHGCALLHGVRFFMQRVHQQLNHDKPPVKGQRAQRVRAIGLPAEQDCLQRQHGGIFPK